MQSNNFTHAFQSSTFTVREFEDGSERLETYLQALATKVNSRNEEFSPEDTFTMETTFIRTPGPGRGHGKRYKPSAAAGRVIVKRSRVTIKNKDQVTMKSVRGRWIRGCRLQKYVTRTTHSSPPCQGTSPIS